jgi:putative ABC transport system substrate-binding protein
MKRRSVIFAGLAALLLAPEHPSAQQSPGKIPRVGILTTADNERTPALDAFRAGLHDLGYVEGRNIILEFRFTRGDPARGLQLAAELVALPVDVIVAEGVGAQNKFDPSGRTPIVSPAMMDPVERGFAVSLAHPGGNITGFTLMHTELNGKRLDLLRSAFPHITVAALVNPANPSHKLALEQTETAARSLGLGNVRRVETASAATLRALRPEVLFGADAVVVVPDGTFYNYRRDVIALINAAHLPAIYPEREYADDGGLMSYGANAADNFRRAADYVDRILKGAKPGDLPIQEPVKFDFVVNLKTAKDLGLAIPPLILGRADEVIE